MSVLSCNIDCDRKIKEYLMETIEEYCSACRRMTIWNIIRVTPGRSDRKKDVIAIRCSECDRVALRKVDQKEGEEDA